MRAVDLTKSAVDGVERVVVILDERDARAIARLLLAHEGHDAGVRAFALTLAPDIAPPAPVTPLDEEGAQRC